MTFGIAWAQTSATPPGLAPAAGGTSSGGSEVLGFVVVILALLVIVGVAIKIYDRKRMRDAEAVHLQAQVSDALMLRLAGLALTPTARIFGGVATVEITGQVPDEATHKTVLRVAREEVARLRPEAQIEDRLAVRRGAVAA